MIAPNIPILLVSYQSEFIKNSLVNRRCHYGLRKYSFCNRITNVWNNVPEDIVTAPLVNTFKNRLDKFWSIQDLKYNWQAEITGTGSRSKVFS